MPLDLSQLENPAASLRQVLNEPLDRERSRASHRVRVVSLAVLERTGAPRDGFINIARADDGSDRLVAGPQALPEGDVIRVDTETGSYLSRAKAE